MHHTLAMFHFLGCYVMKIIQWSTTDPIQQQAIIERAYLKIQNQVTEVVRTIISDVRTRGDAALSDYTQQFHGLKLESLVYANDEQMLDPTLQSAIDDAFSRISRYHALHHPQSIELDTQGIRAWKQATPIERVGLYVPSGSAPLISTLLMLGVPAMVAQCPNRVLCIGPNAQGKLDPAMRYAAKLCGIETIYSVGGAQAIAAMAYGTETIPKVDKIFGPGNKYVTEAKMQVAQDSRGAALDMPAGPSEVLVIADAQADAACIASDLLAQAEHDPDAGVLCLTTDRPLAQAIVQAITTQTLTLSRRHIIEAALTHAYVVIVDDLASAFEISNAYAPEHLILHLDHADQHVGRIKKAGSVFLGRWSAEAIGDYAAGPNHVLPTYGYAKNYSGLGVDSFMTHISFQCVSDQGLLAIAPTVETLAAFEGLTAHQASVRLRRQQLEMLL
jgi:histidinol dehydrogenase